MPRTPAGKTQGARASARPSRRPASAHVETKRRAKRMRILEGAVRSFAARGFYGTSMDDIAEELLLTRGSLYYYFRDKEEILALCHTVALDAVLDVLTRVKAAALPPEAAMRRLISEHVRIMVDKFHGTALALDLEALTGKRRADVIAARDKYEKGLREILAEGIRRKTFRPADPKLVTFAVFGAINWIARWYRAGGGASAEEIGELFAGLFLSGLASGEGKEEA